MSKRWRCQRAVIPLQISAVTLTADMGALRDRITGDPFDDPTRQPIDDKREEVEQAIGAGSADGRNGAAASPRLRATGSSAPGRGRRGSGRRSEEHTSELQSLMRISYAGFCLNKTQTQAQTD